jgi:hypothetical protein
VRELLAPVEARNQINPALPDDSTMLLPAMFCTRRRRVGYDVLITRKQCWSDEKGPEIPLAEWIAVVGTDPDMRLDGYAETRVGDGSILRLESEGLSVWTAYSRHSENDMAWFNFHEGNVVVKNPDPEILQKMWSLAQALSAKVQGDDGEFYDASGTQVRMRPQAGGERSLWRFW